MAPHSSTLAWKIPWTEEPGRLQSMGSRRVRHDWATSLSLFTFTFHFHALEKEMATHSSVLAWRIPGTGEPGGLPSMGSHRVGHYWSDLTAAAAAIQTHAFIKGADIEYSKYFSWNGSAIKKYLGSTRRVNKTAHGLSTETCSGLYESVALRKQTKRYKREEQWWWDCFRCCRLKFIKLACYSTWSSGRGAWWVTTHGVTKSQTWLSHWACHSVWTRAIIFKSKMLIL